MINHSTAHCRSTLISLSWPQPVHYRYHHSLIHCHSTITHAASPDSVVPPPAPLPLHSTPLHGRLSSIFHLSCSTFLHSLPSILYPNCVLYFVCDCRSCKFLVNSCRVESWFILGGQQTCNSSVYKMALP